MPVTTQSSIPDFALALQTGLAAQLVADGITGVQVVLGPPAPNVLDLPEFIAILDTEVDVTVRALDRTMQPRDERYMQLLEISVVKMTRSDSATVEARAFALYQSLHTLLRATPALNSYYAGPGQLVAAKVAHLRVARRAEEERREASIVVSVDVHVRL